MTRTCVAGAVSGAGGSQGDPEGSGRDDIDHDVGAQAAVQVMDLVGEGQQRLLVYSAEPGSAYGLRLLAAVMRNASPPTQAARLRSTVNSEAVPGAV